MVLLDVELLSELAVHRLDNLPHPVDALGHRLWQLPLLIGTRYSHQAHTVAQKQCLGHTLGDVPFVSHRIQVCMFFQQFIATLQVGNVGRDKHEVHDHSSQCDEQLHLVAEEGLLFGGNTTEGSSVDNPLFGGLWGQVKLHHRHRQTIYAALAVLGHIEHPQYHPPNQVESVPKPSSASVEAALRRDVREQVTMVIPLRQQGQLSGPTLTLSNHAHGHQLTVRAGRRRARVREEGANLSVGIFHDAVHPQAEIVKAKVVRYH